MIDLSIHQALFDGPTLRAKSADFADDWVPITEQIIAAYGTPPAGVNCPEALFVLEIGPKHILIGQVAGPPTFHGLRFRLLAITKELYFHLHDPFLIAERFPPNWDAGRGQLPTLEWPADAPPTRRTVAQLAEVLKQNDPWFLGAAQTLVDTGRIAIESPEPLTKRVRDLWTLLPDSTRRSCWFTTFAFSEEIGLDLIVLPKLPEGPLHGYLTEEQARDYPESRYERNLQVAVESGDQGSLDRLLARRSSQDTLKLALFLIVAFLIGGIIVKFT